MVNSVLLLHHPQIFTKNIKLSLHYDDEIPEYLVSDEKRIHRIILELTANAIKFTDQGEITVSVVLEKQTSHQYIRFSLNPFHLKFNC